jgi:UDP-N-acetylglucosamine--N-acetylmuramyl-(pentapeptide) pyrophosphoryl-undecaprenol N-acetylglucosamine transferase
MRRFALVAGGGTGGHTIPALAVARALEKERGPGSVELVGSRRGLDARILESTGIPVTLLHGRGLIRRRSRSATLSNLVALAELAAAAVASFRLIATRRPAVVVAVGGYACVPPSLAAALLGVPVVILNVDAVPGAANRLVARFARAAAVAYPGTELPRSVVTGPPVREEMVAVRDAIERDPGVRKRARERLGLPLAARVVAVSGGSLGARRLNEAVIDMAGGWTGSADVAIFHVVGDRDFEWAKEAASGIDSPMTYVQVPYEEHMELFYAAADLAVCRSGANTVAELAVTGTPAVLVPLPGAPGDHQSANAAVLERCGAAVVVRDEELDAVRLTAELERVLPDRERLEEMAAAARRIGKPGAAESVAALAVSHARQRRTSGRGADE